MLLHQNFRRHIPGSFPDLRFSNQDPPQQPWKSVCPQKLRPAPSALLDKSPRRILDELPCSTANYRIVNSSHAAIAKDLVLPCDRKARTRGPKSNHEPRDPSLGRRQLLAITHRGRRVANPGAPHSRRSGRAESEEGCRRQDGRRRRKDGRLRFGATVLDGSCLRCD